MLVPWLLLMTTYGALCFEVTETIEDIDSSPLIPPNTTILHPVPNRRNTSNDQITNGAISTATTLWNDSSPSSSSTEVESSKSEEDRNITTKEQPPVEKSENATTTFKPSPFFESFFDSLDPAPTQPFIPKKKPSSGFKSSPKDHFKSLYGKYPKSQFPFQLESPILTKTKPSWRPEPELLQDSKPTAELPVRVPAGGLYQVNDPFKAKPGADSDDEDFGLEFNEMEIRNHHNNMRKHTNPWQQLVRLATALIPAGIIFSALTPALITVHHGPDQSPPRVYRRSTSSSPLAAISERCRRRLLCELHSELYYTSQATSLLNKDCRRIRCEDPEALTRSLTWLLNYHKTVNEDNG